MNPKVGIILVNYNSSFYTIKCIKSIFCSEYKSFEIIVVDNDSDRRDFDKLREIDKNKITLVRNKENFGFGQANNIGIKKALSHKCDYILILNNDTTINNLALSEFVKSAGGEEFDKNNTILSSIILDKNNKIWFNGLFDMKLINFPKTKDKTKSISEINKIDKIKSEYSTGCCMFFSKNIVNNNLFDKNYFLYFEDFDFSFGKENIVIQKPLIIHEISASSGIKGKEELTNLQAYYFGRNSILFYFTKKKINLVEKIIYLILGIWIRPILYIRDLGVFKSYFLGTRDGLRKYLR